MSHRFGHAEPFSLGVEEELLLVQAEGHALSHSASELLPRLAGRAGSAQPDTYEAVVELTSPICATPAQGVGAVTSLRAELSGAGATAMGAGIHPAAAFGDVVHVPARRYERVAELVRGLLRRTPTCALHVHVGMPDPETAIRCCNGLRAHLPLLQALAANSPFWAAADSGFASSRSALFRGYPLAEIPRAFADWGDYEQAVDEMTRAGGVEDYTFLWWDIRPHPRLGTVEVRAMDAQSSLGSVAGLAALVQALARDCAEPCAARQTPESREAITQSLFRAARDGIEATLWCDGALRPVAEVAERALTRATPHAAELGGADELEQVRRIVREGGGASGQRAAHERGGMAAVLELLVAETAAQP